jgi:hypothetical protein
VNLALHRVLRRRSLRRRRTSHNRRIPCRSPRTTAPCPGARTDRLFRYPECAVGPRLLQHRTLQAQATVGPPS